jgi:predicted Zn finger-like uncharacterized protein
MIEIQCPSCQTRYRVDERILPEDNPTFKCSRCGHVFASEPRPGLRRAPAQPVPKPGFPRTQDSRPPAAPFPVRPSAPQTSKPAFTPPKDIRSGNIQSQPPSAASASQPAPSKPAAAVHQSQIFPVRKPTSPEPERVLPIPEKPQPDPDGENLTFDFNEDEDAEIVIAPENDDLEALEEWEVGEEREAPRMDMDMDVLRADEFVEPTPTKPPGAPGRFDEREHLAYRAPVPVEQVRVHSSGFFLMIFFAIVVMFALISGFLISSPAAGREWISMIPTLGDHFKAPPGLDSIVRLHDPHAEYRQLKGGQNALVVSGRAENISQQPLHAIRIAINLLDGSQHPLVQQSIYCGNVISGKMISEMTAREIEFFQRLDPPKNFVVKPGDSPVFLVVFLNPPGQPHLFSIHTVAAVRAAQEGTPRT